MINRLTSPTPNFFKKLRNIGLILTAVSTVVLTSPVALPVAIITAAGYAATIGGSIAAVCQLTTPNEK